MNRQGITSHGFDRLGWLQESGYLARQILFLDLNHWINLSRGQNDIYRELSGALHEAVEAEEIICPVSPSLLMEVMKQRQTEARYQCMVLMDRLSGRLSLRLASAIFTQEFRAQILGQKTEKQIAYSFFLDAMSASGLRLDLPTAGWLPGMADRMERAAFDRFTSISIPQAINIPTEEQRERSIGTLRGGWSELVQQAGEWRKQNQQASIKDIEQAEFASTVDALVRPAADTLQTDPALLPSLRSMANMSENERREMLEACPTFWCEYKLLAAVRSRKTTPKVNDLWDLEHVASAAPYVDCLACDKGTRDISTQTVRADEKYETKIVARPDEILAWVRS